MKPVIAKISLAALCVAGSIWLGGVNIRAVIGFDLFETGTLDFKTNIHPYVERAVFALTAGAPFLHSLLTTVASPIGALKKHALLAGICAVFFAGGLLRLNDLSAYPPDSCRYLIWGNSLAHGAGFVDATQPVPDRFVVHAPLYALLIVPAELFFP